LPRSPVRRRRTSFRHVTHPGTNGDGPARMVRAGPSRPCRGRARRPCQPASRGAADTGCATGLAGRVVLVVGAVVVGPPEVVVVVGASHGTGAATNDVSPSSGNGLPAAPQTAWLVAMASGNPPLNGEAKAPWSAAGASHPTCQLSSDVTGLGVPSAHR